ncbi:MAG TPA: bifunctional nuclease domain-containing protein [Actinomycetes bacterium]|nr:bifunctional nuclease domain-containing protein [Actinomycetes bacterium]
MDDVTLVRRAREGDEGAFAELVARHRPMVVGVCRRVLGDPGLAEDAAQEAVLLAMVSLDRLERPERFGAWLGGIGRNVCRRWRRDQAREAWSLAALTGGRAGPDPVPDEPAESAEAADAARRVRRAVARLPAGQRAAVVLFYLVGMAHREVAAALGIGVGAVKTRLHKGRAALREELAAWWREDDMATATGPVTLGVAEVRRQPEEEGRPEKTAILLSEAAGERRLCIWVGAFEGLQIAFALEGTELPRPMAYQFMTSLLAATGGRLAEARVTGLEDGTFYGVAVVEGPAGTQEVDARPSDVLNLALLTGAPVRVDPGVLAEASESERGARYLAEASAYPDGTAAIVAEFQAEMERTRAEYLRRR